MILRFKKSAPRLLPYYLLLMLSGMLSSCMKKPVFMNIDAVKMNTLKDSVLETVISFKIYNPNSISSTLTASTIKTWYKGKLVGNSTITNDVDLPGNDTVIIPMVSKIELWELAEVFPELLASEQAVFRIEGNNKVKALGGKWNVPVKEDIQLNVKQAVINEVNKTFQSNSNFKVRDLKVSKLPGLNTMNFHLLIQLKNSFPFDYKLIHFALNIYRKNGTFPVVDWKMTDTMDQKSGSISAIPIDITVNNTNILREANLSDILHPNLEILLKGEATISIQDHLFVVPIEEIRKITFHPLTGFNF